MTRGEIDYSSLSEAEQKKRKVTLERAKATYLSAQLRLRLQYAKLKVDHGWQRQTLNEVENLYFRHSHMTRPKPYSRPPRAEHSSQSSSSSASTQPQPDGHSHNDLPASQLHVPMPLTRNDTIPTIESPPKSVEITKAPLTSQASQGSITSQTSITNLLLPAATPLEAPSAQPSVSAAPASASPTKSPSKKRMSKKASKPAPRASSPSSFLGAPSFSFDSANSNDASQTTTKAFQGFSFGGAASYQPSNPFTNSSTSSSAGLTYDSFWQSMSSTSSYRHMLAGHHTGGNGVVANAQVTTAVGGRTETGSTFP